MTGREEHAAGDRRGPFPRAWGVPRGEPGSEERAGWVLAQVRRLVIGRKQTPEQREDLLQRAAAVAMTAATLARSDEDRAVTALLRHAERHPRGEQRTDPVTADLDDEDLIGLLIAADHGVSTDQIEAAKSLGRSRGLALDEVLRACFAGELAAVVRLPALEQGKRRRPSV